MDSWAPTYSFGGPTSLGGPSAGRDVNIYPGLLRAAPVVGLVPPDELDELREVHVPGPGYDKACGTLRDRHVLILCGDELSGRRATALRLLTHLAGKAVYGLRPTDGLDTVCRDHRPDRGYLLDSRPGVSAATLDQVQLSALEDTLRQVGSFLVVTIPAHAARDLPDLDRYLVEHGHPNPHKVLDRHLRCGSSTHANLLKGWLADPRLGERVDRMVRPQDAVALALQLMKEAEAGTSLDDVLKGLGSSATRSEAQALLSTTTYGEHDLTRLQQLYWRAFVVALAVFNDTPYLPVVAAAQDLAEHLGRTEYPRWGPPGKAAIFSLKRDDWLTALGGELVSRDREGASDEQRVEHVRMRNRDLPAALLDELWTAYDGARTPLLNWLKGLIQPTQPPEIQVRAAQSVGWLAVHDFDSICRRIIRQWAGSRLPSQHMAAAWALEFAATSGGLAPRVRVLLAEWCRSANLAHQATAVLAYGTTIGVRDPAEALRNLRSPARSGNATMTAVVSRSVIDLFTGGAEHEVLNALQEWDADNDDRIRVAAAGALVELAYEADETGTPALLKLFAGADPAAKSLTELWRAALQNQLVRADAWEALRKWFVWADKDPTLHVPLAHLLTAIERVDPTLRTRVAWYLRFWQHHPKEPSATAEKIRSAWEE